MVRYADEVVPRHKGGDVISQVIRYADDVYMEPGNILALGTAMRRGELLALATDGINYERRSALVRDSKNGVNRVNVELS
ncbi:hypothetical protein CR155_17965 [Pollutimonas nitritireducens]|uniref:Uncharacterized protein n=2 Tax=Pollutimonas nitritireducens TaxID=2045209 RepID=A0A2N4UBJ8_9BURK|nr:hypothetical protein CR155_17965 [Pollutimonas nitritireducens]